MEQDDGDIPIEIPDIGTSLSKNQLRDLQNLFIQPGWKILERIWQDEKTSCVECGMSLNASEEYRASDRGVYHKLLDLLCLEGNVRHTYDVAMGLIKEVEI